MCQACKERGIILNGSSTAASVSLFDFWECHMPVLSDMCHDLFLRPPTSLLSSNVAVGGRSHVWGGGHRKFDTPQPS